MHVLDATLALWKETYAQLGDARKAWKDDMTNPALKAEVERLQLACGKALDAMQAEVARVKARGDSQGDSR